MKLIDKFVIPKHDGESKQQARFPYAEDEIRFLSTLFYHRCMQPHDKVYGIYAMLENEGYGNLPEPDYEKPFQQVFEETVRAIIAFREDLGVLTLAVRPHGPRNDFPSWVPDFTDEVQHAESNGSFAGTDFVLGTGLHNEQPKEWEESKSFKATKTSKFRPANDAPGTLTVHGYHLGKVLWREALKTVKQRDTKLPWPLGLNYETIRTMRSWCHHVASLESSTGRPESAAQNFLEAISLGGSLGNRTALKVSEKWFDLMLYPNCRRSDIIDLLAHVDTDESDEDVVWNCLHYCWTGASAPEQSLVSHHTKLTAILSGYSLMVLDSGYLALAWSTCIENDDIFLVQGCSTPLVLRQSYIRKGPMVPDGQRTAELVTAHHAHMEQPEDSSLPSSSHDQTSTNSQYKLVAPAYVEGAMFGALWPYDERDIGGRWYAPKTFTTPTYPSQTEPRPLLQAVKLI